MTTTNNFTHTKPKADLWFGTGERLPYNYHEKKIDASADSTYKEGVFIWNKVINGDHSGRWTTMMPGFPDGSFGWASTEQYLSKDQAPRVYVDYIGMGDSDKPENYNYGVIERADMIEALWKHHNIKDTVLVTFDFSSLVALELLSRQIENERGGQETLIHGALLINGGYFSDSHSHPILTTPLLKTFLGRMGTKIAQNSAFAFSMMVKDLWSKEYGVSKEELVENHKAIKRREGAIFMSNAAGFVDEHKLNAQRWDLKRIFKATFPDVKYIVAGSEKDQFEPKQVKKAQKELEHLGLIIDMYPGGHMTTSEHPDMIANTIQRLKSIVQA